MEAIAAAQTVGQLVGAVVQVMKKIRRAVKDVNDLPTNTQELLKLVERLDPLIVKIQDKVQDKDGLLKPQLLKLSVQLRQASRKVDEFLELRHKHKIVEVTLATFNYGAAKQQKEIKVLCEAIERTREELDKMLNIGTYTIVEATHSIVRGLQVTGEESARTGERLELGVEALHLKVDQLQREPPAPPSSIEQPPIIAYLDRWAVQCLTDECYKVQILLAESYSNSFLSPGEESQRLSLAANEGEATRGAREGGWEVMNSTKVRLQITAEEDCFFYLLSFERGLPNGTNVELIFPKFAAYNNQIFRAGRRTFPDKRHYKTDPATFKVDKSPLLTDGIGQVLVYIVLSDSSLIQDGQEEADIIDYIKEQLSFSKDNSHVSYVEKFYFEVK